MQTECTPSPFEFEAVGRRAVVAQFDGGTMTSNAGALLLRQVDRGLGLIRRFAQCFTDRRDQRFVEHSVETLAGQRVFGLVLGYEDLNDHDELRKDPAFAVLAGKLKSVLRPDCEPVAGKSTLHRLEHTPKRNGAKYHKIDCDGDEVDALLVDVFLEWHKRAPGQIVLDLDATDIPLHGHQEGRFFHGYYDKTATCRSMCFAAGICCLPGCAARTSTPVPVRSRRSHRSWHASAGGGRAYGSSCAPTPALLAKR
jgi:hypothetical protein